ncbi:DUF896 domain-containing protein [Bacillaceae bacterium SIJ1]|uniref:DUF896 domain-containing protein n=1 Tax=Litoribacterium kuwaitense TaxID=1398745 RepID=UPI0013EB6CAE|nr:DUF896 domain-containing protein [Litoribacterium kuwaitense]NGP44043.1 DUF896 domain-containing protein [Litoribacterium kuwaitense]
MLSQQKLNRINELAQKKKYEGLTKQETDEQQTLRKEYLQVFRQSMTNHLHQVKVVDEEGNDVTPEKLKKSKNQRHSELNEE